MRRGTTTTIIITANGLDLSEMETIYLTLKQNNVEVTKSGSELKIENGKIHMFLDQQDTLRFKNGYAHIQLRAMSKSGAAVASNIKNIAIDEILKEGVIT